MSVDLVTPDAIRRVHETVAPHVRRTPVLNLAQGVDSRFDQD